MHIAGKTIEFRDDDGALRLASLRKRAAEFGAALESVGTLPGLDLDMLADEIDPFGLGEVLDSGFLRLDPQSTLALSGRRNAVISDCVAHRSRPDLDRSHILPPFNIWASSFSTEILLFQLLYAVVPPLKSSPLDSARTAPPPKR